MVSVESLSILELNQQRSEYQTLRLFSCHLIIFFFFGRDGHGLALVAYTFSMSLGVVMQYETFLANNCNKDILVSLTTSYLQSSWSSHLQINGFVAVSFLAYNTPLYHYTGEKIHKLLFANKSALFSPSGYLFITRQKSY